MIKKPLYTLIYLSLLAGMAFCESQEPAQRQQMASEPASRERILQQPDAAYGAKAKFTIAAPAKPVAPQPAKKQESVSKAVVIEEKPATKKPSLTRPADIVPEKKEIAKKAKRGIFAGETGFALFGAGPKKTAIPDTIIPESGPVLMTIDECVKIAVANSIPLMTATKSLKLAEMRVFEARRNMLPTATIVAEETYGRVNARSYAGRKQYIEGQQPVFHGGELYYAVKQAEANLEVTRNEYAKQKNELVHTVKKAYYTLAKAKENLKIQKELKKEADLIFSSVSKASEAGVITKVESLNVSSQSSQIDYQIISAEGDVEVAELILKQAMNVDPKQNINTMPLPEFVKVDVDYGDALRTAYLSRPEMKINRFLIDYYDFGVRVAKGKGWPKIDLLGSWGLAKEEYTPADNCWDIDTGPNGTGAQGYQAPQRKLEQQWYAGVKASMPLWGSTLEYSHTREQWVPVVSAYQGTQAATNSVKFKILDKLDYYSDVQLADVDLSRARQEYIKIKNEITLEVREACFSYQKALVQLDTTADKIKYQKTDVDVAKVKRGLDEASDSNVIDSMIKLAQEEFSHAQAVTDCHTSLSAINKAVGIEDRFKDTARRGVSAATDNVS